MTRRTWFVVTTLLLPFPLAAQTAGARSHDGFFLRFLTGAGPAEVVMEEFQGQDMVFSSPAGTGFHIQIGGAVRPNLILFGDLGGFAMVEPDVEIGGMSGASNGPDVTVSGLGGGVSYYLMPLNTYASASVMISTALLTFQDGGEGETGFGPGVYLVLGKEWWVGNKWGLGAALYAEVSWTQAEGSWTQVQPDDPGNPFPVNSRAFGVAFSATMN